MTEEDVLHTPNARVLRRRQFADRNSRERDGTHMCHTLVERSLYNVFASEPEQVLQTLMSLPMGGGDFLTRFGGLNGSKCPVLSGELNLECKRLVDDTSLE